MVRRRPKNKTVVTGMMNILFYIVYLILNFFITVGEFTQRTVTAPFLFIWKAILFIRQLVINARSTKKLPVRMQKAPVAAAKRPRKTPWQRQCAWLSARAGVNWRKSRKRSIKIGKLVGAGLIFYSAQVINITLRFIWYVVSGTAIFVYRIVKAISNFVLTFVTIPLRFFILGFIVCLIIVVINQASQFVHSLPSPREIGKINYALSTHIYDRNNKLLYEIYGDQNRTPIQLSKLPAYIPQAAIAIEDKDFYHHKGVSLVSGILRAAKENFLTHNVQGGSTITQQLVKSALLSPERTVTRKLKEIILALWTEQIYSKNQILEMYLNQVPYGGSAYGIEAAAETYFGKHASELNIGEAALLAGLPQAPSSYSPFSNPDAALERRNEVLNQMYKQGYINKDQLADALASKPHIIPPQNFIKAPHFVFYVKDNLDNQYGIRSVEENGLKVTTTLDLDLQTEVEKIMREELDKVRSLNISNAAVLVTKPGTGEILAMAGSADYFAQPSGAFNVTTALRQPGSSIKPLMYSLALEKGYTAATIIDDSPTTFYISGSEVYRPVNYDGKFHGKVPLRIALANSFNIPAVKVLNSIGIDAFVEHARKMGITTWDDTSGFGLSITLGGVETKMVDMATAYGVFANAGYKVPLRDVLTMENVQGDKLPGEPIDKTRVMDEGITYIMSDILSDNFARQLEFGPNSALEISGKKVAVKTGTTDNKKDNFTIGYTPDYVVAVWVGNNNGDPMNQALASGITGAAPIWNRVMSYLLKNYQGGSNDWFTKPDDVVEKTCFYGRPEFFIRGTENSVPCYGPSQPSGSQPTNPPAANNNQFQVQAATQPAVVQPQNHYNKRKSH